MTIDYVIEENSEVKNINDDYQKFLDYFLSSIRTLKYFRNPNTFLKLFPIPQDHPDQGYFEFYNNSSQR
ncbi:hypothetical protein HYV49_02640 [Candidatus Pacearchaeota archaeon]|nr:hypothetical protein [Candidatus Pacearchaeota archaeon]